MIMLAGTIRGKNTASWRLLFAWEVSDASKIENLFRSFSACSDLDHSAANVQKISERSEELHLNDGFQSCTRLPGFRRLDSIIVAAFLNMEPDNLCRSWGLGISQSLEMTV